MTQNLPAYLQKSQNRGLAQTLSGNLGAGSPPFLSIMGNRFTLIDGVGDEIPIATYDPKIGPYIDCIVIDALERTSKIYYDKLFDPGANQYEPPACFSDNGVAPSRNASRPQSPTCASCPQGAWGSKVSAVSGKGVKACADIQKIAIVVPGYEMPFLLRVPPNSRTNFRSYVHKFVGQPFDIADVTTRVTFEQGGIGTLKFDAIGYIDEASFAQREKLVAAKVTDAMVGRTDLPRQEALPAPSNPTTLPPPGQQFLASAPNNPVPFVAPPAATPSMNQAPSSPASQGQPAMSASPSEQPPRRRRRSQAEMQAGQPAPAGQAQQAPFMPQNPVQSPAPGNGTRFGIQQAATPNPALQETLNSLFGPK